MPDITVAGTNLTLHFPDSMKPADIAAAIDTHPVVRQMHYDDFVNRPDPAWNTAIGGYQAKYFASPTDGSVPNQLLQKVQAIPGTYERLDLLNQLSPNLSDVGKAAILQQAMQNRGETGASIGPPPTPGAPNLLQRGLSAAGNALSLQRDALAAAVQPFEFGKRQQYGGLQATGDPAIDAQTDFTTQQALANMPYLQRLAALRGQPLNALGQPMKQLADNQAGHALSPVGQAGNALMNMGGAMAVDPLTWETLGLGTALHGLAAAAPEGSLAARAATVLPRAVSAGFAAQQIGGGLPEIWQGIQNHDIGQVTQGTAGTLLGAFAGAHAAGFGAPGAAPVEVLTDPSSAMALPTLFDPAANLAPPAVLDATGTPFSSGDPNAPQKPSGFSVVPPDAAGGSSPVPEAVSTDAVAPPVQTAPDPSQVAPGATPRTAPLRISADESMALSEALGPDHPISQALDHSFGDGRDRAVFQVSPERLAELRDAAEQTQNLPGSYSRTALIKRIDAAAGSIADTEATPAVPSVEANEGQQSVPATAETAVPPIAPEVQGAPVPTVSPADVAPKPDQVADQPAGGRPATFAGPRKATVEAPTYAANINLDNLSTPDEVKSHIQDTARAMATQIEQARGGVISQADTAEAAKALGLTPEQLAKVAPGERPAYALAVRQLLVDTAQRVKDAQKAYQANDSSENMLALQKATAEYQTTLLSAAGHAAEAGRTLAAYRMMADAQRGTSPVDAMVEEVTKPVRQKVNPRTAEFGASNKLFVKSDAEAAIARIRQALGEKTGAGKLNVGADPTGGRLDNIDAEDLAKVGGYLLEGGLREFGKWAGEMRAQVSSKLTDGQLQHTWANLRAEVVKQASKVHASTVFVDQLGKRLGREGASSFADDVGTDTLHSLINGEKLTPDQQRTVAQAYLDHQPKPGKGMPATGALGTVDDLVTEARAERSAAAKANLTPPTAQDTFLKTLTSRLGSDGAAAFRESIKGTDGKEDLLNRLSLGKPLSSAERAQVGAAFEANKPARTAATPTEAAQNLSDIVQEVRNARADAAKANKPAPTDEENFDRALTRRLGIEGAKAFRTGLDPETSAALVSGKDLTDEQKSAVAKAYLDNQRPAATTAPATGIISTVDDVVNEARKAKADAEKASKAPPTPVESMISTLTRRLGKDGADAVREKLKDANGNETLLNKLANGKPLTMAERAQVGEAYAVAEKPSVKAKPTDAQKTLSEVVKETKDRLGDQGIDTLRGMTPKEIALKMLLEDGRADANRIAAKLAGIDDNDIAGLSKVMRQEVRIPALQQAVSLWKAGLLSSPRTVAKVIAAHGISLTADELTRIPASVVDMMVSKATGRRTVGGLDPAGMAKAGYRAATQGVLESIQILQHGEANANVEDIGGSMPHDMFGKIQVNNEVAQVYIDGVERMHALAYRTPRLFAFVRALQEHAGLQARAEGLKGADYADRIKYLIDNPTDDLTGKAIDDAERAVFLNKNALTQFIASGKAGKAAWVKAGVDTLLPFHKAGSNLATRFAEYTLGAPLAIARLAIDASDGTFMDGASQRRFSQTMGRQVVGVAAMAMGGYLASKGLLTGFGHRKDDVPEGALRIGNRWAQIGQFGPVAPLMVVGATLTERQDNGKGGAANFGSALAHGIQENPLSGMAKTVSSLDDVEKATGRQGGSVVPQAISDLAAQMDSQQRKPGGPLDYLKERVPGLRQTVPGTGRPEANKLFDPTNSVKVQ